MNANQQVNRLGKYLYNYLDSAFKYTTSSNTCDVYFLLLYQITGQLDVQEMNIDISVTTYQNKIRVNVIEISPEERTIGYSCYDPEFVKNLKEASVKIYQDILKKVSKAYKDIDFLIWIVIVYIKQSINRINETQFQTLEQARLDYESM